MHCLLNRIEKALDALPYRLQISWMDQKIPEKFFIKKIITQNLFPFSHFFYSKILDLLISVMPCVIFDISWQ
jgi:hypothetical protein